MALDHTVVTLTDNNTYFINLHDEINYALVEKGWSPAIAKRRQASVGGQCPFEDVVEEIKIDIFATSYAVLNNKLSDLAALFDLAMLWQQGLASHSVYMYVEPQGTPDGQGWYSLIRSGEVILPQDYVDGIVTRSIDNVTLLIKRMGIWTKNLEVHSNTASGTPATKRSVTIGSAVQPYSPMRVRLSGVTYDNNLYNVWKTGIWVITDADANIAMCDAANFINGVNATNFTNSTALGGSYTRLQNAARIDIPVPATFNKSGLVAVFAAIKPTTPQSLKLRFQQTNGNISFQQAEFYANSNNKVTFIGVFEWNISTTHVRISIPVSFGGEVCDIDYVCLVNVSDANTHIVEIEEPAISYLNPLPTTTSVIYLYNNPLLNRTPVFHLDVNNTGNEITLAHYGDAWLTTNGTVWFVNLAMSNGSLYWQPWNAATTSVQNLTLQISVLPAQVTLR